MLFDLICHFTVAKELAASIKPAERTSIVANRLIGAALGIRLPSNASTGKIAKVRTNSPPRIDAWDD